jgi:indole-3-glycerol phosphate synthase
MSILDKIVAFKKGEILEHQREIPLSQLKDNPLYHRQGLSISKWLAKPDDFGIIAEFKRRSPSKPSINLTADPTVVTPAYEKAGVAGISVLTDSHFFGGGLTDLMIAREAVKVPLLRKDFIIQEYQVHQAKASGADFILLIAEILDKYQVQDLADLAQSLGLEVLLEMHAIDQLDKYNSSVNVLGINNRNLKTFTTDIRFSLNQYDALPEEALKISESGIHSKEAIMQLKEKGYHGFLIGEQFMKSDNPGQACAHFIQSLKS